MSVIEKLDGVLANWRAKSFGNQTWNDVMEACADELDALMPAIRQDMIDARRYRMLRDEATSEQIAAFVARRRTRLAADRVCDAAIDARLASDSEWGPHVGATRWNGTPAPRVKGKAMIKREEGVAVATWLSIAAAMGADFSIPRRAVPERDKRTPDDAAERMAAAEAKRQRKAAKRLRLVPEADSGGDRG